MTRNFSNQRRDDTQPSPRNSAPGKYREEQSSRPARPRLSRDAVDRAWENGATRTYADYHPRQNPQTSPTQRPGRPTPAYERSRQPQNRRPYESSQETHGAPRQGGYQPHQRPEDGQRRFNQPGGYRAPGGQPGLNNERWTRNDAPQRPGNYEDNRPPRFPQQSPNPNYREDNRPPRFQQNSPNPNFRGTNQPSRFQHDGPNPNYREDNRPPRFQQNSPNPNYRGTNRPRPFERSDGDRFAGGKRNNANGVRDSYNPRWQSRPGPQRVYADQQRGEAVTRNEYISEQPGRAQFDGDYERFTEHERVNKREQVARPEPIRERPATRLPDGRVLKGSRVSQRKQAGFWNGVEGQTSELLPNVSPTQEHAGPSLEAVPQERPTTRPARPKNLVRAGLAR